MVRVRVSNLENRATPPAMLISRTRNQIDEGGTSFQTAELGALTAVDWLKAKLSVECNGSSHVTDSERHRTDVLDHPSCSPLAPCQKYNIGERHPCAFKSFPSVQ